jgi:hypothetical protein
MDSVYCALRTEALYKETHFVFKGLKIGIVREYGQNWTVHIM